MAHRTDYQPIVQVKAETLLPPKFGKETDSRVYEAVSFCETASFLCRLTHRLEMNMTKEKRL
jgi:hypothetical protein